MNWDEAADETERDILDDLMDVNYPATDYLIDRAIQEIKNLRRTIGILNKTIDLQNNELIKLDKATDEPIREYDSNGNYIHYKDSNGFEQWWEYDSNGNCIHFKNNDGFEQWYDSDGNKIDNPNKEG